VTLVETAYGKARIGFDCDREVRVMREEIAFEDTDLE
jgi:sRNA-binding carbon storage regulator CsrA